MTITDNDGFEIDEISGQTPESGPELVAVVPDQQLFEFKSECISSHEQWVLPLIMLVGLLKPRQHQVDVLSIAQMLTYEEDEAVLSGIANELHRYAEAASPDGADLFLSMLTSGAAHFPDADELRSFCDENREKAEKFGFDEYSFARYLFHGGEALHWYPDTINALKPYFKGNDLNLFLSFLAITSPVTSPKRNVINALRAYELYKKGKKFEHQNFLPSVVKMLNDFRADPALFGQDPSNKRPKVTSYIKALTGDVNAVVVDSRMMEAVGFLHRHQHKGRPYPYPPSNGERLFVEQYVQILSRIVGCEPRQISAMIWMGVKAAKKTREEKAISVILGEVQHLLPKR